MIATAERPGLPAASRDWQTLRDDFPALRRQVHGKPLVYLDNANTGQRPEAVLAAMERYYRQYNANVSRAVHTLGTEATEAYEGVRDRLAAFVNAPSRNEIIFTRGSTEAINLVAYSWGGANIQAGDAILVTGMEHHANIVPWQLLCERSGATLKVLPVLDSGELDLDALPALLTPEVKLFAFTHVSNALGTINPVVELCRLARERGITTLIDGSQAAPHLRIDVQAIGCDFYAFTGHKMFGPTGTGVLWARHALLAAMPPFLSGGEMIREVDFAGTTFADPPHRFEAGTPNIAGVIGLGAAVDYIEALGMEAIAAREQALADYALSRLQAMPSLRLVGAGARERVPVFSFLVEGVQAQDLATLIDLEGVAVRSGHHCAHPLMKRFGVSATCRASLAFYNQEGEVDQLVNALERARTLLA
ncbi:cysteine desulfurase [Pseudofulvimonas gallinarii]|uniref:Cysteine desulfurase n=1 Tax=Pseudofulvimonas gallinarii TaxID=634155 RepID=A0A4R3LKQ1_9GAMM|nr:cysteine desulfurase [Pseudofulvimonas gallinarii]